MSDQPKPKVLDRVDVSVKVKWPSKNKLGEKTPRIPGVLRQNACEGDLQTNSQNIKKELIKDIDKECTQLCSKKNPSCLRKTDKENIMSFTMEKFYNELRERAPLLNFNVVSS